MSFIEYLNRVYDALTGKKKEEKRKNVEELSKINDAVKKISEKIKGKKTVADVVKDSGNPNFVLSELMALLNENEYLAFIYAFDKFKRRSEYKSVMERLERNFPRYFKLDYMNALKGPENFAKYTQQYLSALCLGDELSKLEAKNLEKELNK